MATGGMEERHAFTFLWKIENMSLYDCGLHGDDICSPYFTTGMPRTRWYLNLIPKDENVEDWEIRIQLNLCEGLKDEIDCEMSIIGGDGSSLETKTFSSGCSDCWHEEVFDSRKPAFFPNDTLTVRCRFWKTNGNFRCSEYIFGRSCIEVKEDSFQWPIEAFSHFKLKQKVTTYVNICFAGQENEFKLIFSLTGLSLKDAVPQIKLVWNGMDDKLSTALKVSVLNNEEKAMITVEEKNIFNQPDDKKSLVFPNFATRKELLEKQFECLSGDVLTLLCEVTTVCISYFLENTKRGINLTTDVAKNASTFSDASSQTSQQRSDISEQSSDSLVTLGEDLLSLYRDHTGSDFELRSVDVSLPVHKQVLMARSPVFRAMFCSDMRESGTHSLDVPDVDAHTLNRMLTFLYAGTVDPELQWEAATRLYYAADKYQVQSLKQRCSSILQSSISVLNVSDILTLADRHQDKELTSFVQDFILRRFNDMITDEWYAFLEQNPSLAGTTMKHGFRRKLEMTKSQ